MSSQKASNSSHLSPNARKVLDLIRETIVIALKKHLYIPSGLQEWIHALPSGAYVVVRSSSSEDGKNTANAGGNATVMKKADCQQIAIGLNEVVISYFMEKSLEQLILGKECIYKLPLLCCFVQHFIGEPPLPQVAGRPWKRVLLGKKWLEAILFQEYNSQIIHSFSFQQFLREVKGEQKAKTVWHQASPLDAEMGRMNNVVKGALISSTEAEKLFIQFYKVKVLAMTPELAQRWENFVLLIAKSRSERLNGALCQLLITVQKFHLTPLFLHTLFEDCWVESKGRSERCLHLMYTQIIHAQAVVDKFDSLQQETEVWNEKKEQFARPDKIGTATEKILEAFAPLLLDSFWSERLLDSKSDRFEKNLITVA